MNFSHLETYRQVNEEKSIHGDSHCQARVYKYQSLLSAPTKAIPSQARSDPTMAMIHHEWNAFATSNTCKMNQWLPTSPHTQPPMPSAPPAAPQNACRHHEAVSAQHAPSDLCPTCDLPCCSTMIQSQHTMDDGRQDTPVLALDRDCTHTAQSSSRTTPCHRTFSLVPTLGNASLHSLACTICNYTCTCLSGSRMCPGHCTPAMHCNDCYSTQGSASVHSQAHGTWESTHMPSLLPSVRLPV